MLNKLYHGYSYNHVVTTIVTICGACLCPVGSIWPFSYKVLSKL